MRHSHQINEYYCGPAIIQMVLSAFGIRITQRKAAERAGTTKEIGTSTRGLVGALASYNLQIDSGEQKSLADIARAKERGDIIVVCYTETHLNWGHYAIVKNLTPRNISLVDPAERLGKTIILKRKDFQKRWKDPLFTKSVRWAAFVRKFPGENEILKEGVRTLRKDPAMAKLIHHHGRPTSRPQTNAFAALLRSIVYQQLSGKAAGAIHERVLALLNRKPTPEALLHIPAKKLRAAGLSVQKIRYVRDLAHRCLDGTIDEKQLPHLSSSEIIDHLTRVKGIGVWTAHMFLIFTLRRPDILPVGDLGIRKGFQNAYRLKSLPSEAQMERIARPWRRFASYGAWYLWAAADEAKKSESRLIDW